MKKIFYGIFIAVFFIICAVPSAGMLILGESQAAANEILASKPEIMREDGTFNTSLNDDITDYISDRMAFRQEIITAYAAVKAAVSGESAADDVVIGKGGWLFYSKTLDDYLHDNTLSRRSINGIARTVKMMQDYAQSQGADFIFTIAPNKNSLYSQYMANIGKPLGNDKNADMLKKALAAQDADYADLFSVFAAQDEVLYHSRDSHWNNRGAALARDALMDFYKNSVKENISENSAEENFFTGNFNKVNNHKGDLYEMLYPAGKALDENFEPERKFTFRYANGADSYYSDDKPPYDSIRLETVCENAEGNLLMFRDSFGNSLYPFMAESFGHAVFSRQIPYRLDWLASGRQADQDSDNSDYGPVTLLLIEIVERNIPNLAANAPVMPAPAVELQEILKDPNPENPDKTSFTDADIDMLCMAQPADNMQGYTLIKGVYEGSELSNDTRIYINTTDGFFEACPVGNIDWTKDESDEWSKDCSFSAYISGEITVDEIISVVLKSNTECFEVKSIDKLH